MSIRSKTLGELNQLFGACVATQGKSNNILESCRKHHGRTIRALAVLTPPLPRGESQEDPSPKGSLFQNFERGKLEVLNFAQSKLNNKQTGGTIKFRIFSKIWGGERRKIWGTKEEQIWGNAGEMSKLQGLSYILQKILQRRGLFGSEMCKQRL